MGTGHVEELPSGRFRAVLYAGKDPVTSKKIYLKETFATEPLAVEAQNRMLGQVDAGTSEPLRHGLDADEGIDGGRRPRADDTGDDVQLPMATADL